MGFCTRRHFLLSICVLQQITIIQRQTFDFLGYLWIPILANFFEIIFVIFGFFGAFQYRPKYIIAYSVWHLFWLAWNVFLICLYLDIGILDHKESTVLKLDPDSSSWWEINGPNCKIEYNTSAAIPNIEKVTDCLVDYRHVEIFQAGLQCVLAFFGIVTGLFLSKIFLEEDDSSARSHVRKNSSKRTSLYSIEFSQQLEARQGDSDSGEYGDGHGSVPQVSPKPMTPRRVKRRSVMTRGSSGRHSTTSSRRQSSGARSSTRSSRRTVQNPVTRLLEQQQQQKTAQGYDSSASPPPDPLPIYYNGAAAIAASNNNLIPQPHGQWQGNGHANPTYQQSSTQSLNEPDDLDDLYNNRPASVRSSYSNFHGTRAITYGAAQHYHSHATPQVPQKRTANPNRQSMRSMAFLNNGPPAYPGPTPAQNQNSVDSETAI